MKDNGENMRFYKCKKCGNILTSINEVNDNIICCGEEMTLLQSRSVDAAVEKHVPVLIEENGIRKVFVGEVEHPMTEEHYIEFIAVETKDCFLIKKLTPNDKPEFILNTNSEIIKMYAYCNLHGLWEK